MTNPATESPASPLEAARALAPMLGAMADKIEQDRRLPQEVVEALRGAGLFHLTVPKELNGLQADPIMLVQVIEELAAADGSTGWCAMIAAQNATLAGFAERDVAAAIVGGGGIVAGVARPIGRAVPRNGGVVISGRWPFASGRSRRWRTGP